MALPATDSFTATGPTALTTYSASWSKVGTPEPNVASNVLAPGTTGADYWCYWNADTPNNDQYAQFKVTALDTGSDGDGFSLGVRMSTTELTGYVAFVMKPTNPDAIQLYKVSNGSFSEVGHYQANPGYSVGDTIRLQASGSTVTVKINGATVITYNDPSPIASGRVGLHGYITSASNMRVDDWEGGNLPKPSRTAASVVAALKATLRRTASSVTAVLSQVGVKSRTAASVTVVLSGTTLARTAVSTTVALSALGYTSLERKTGVGGTYAEIAKVYPPETEYDDPGPFVSGTTYYYRARTCDQFGTWSDYSAETSWTWWGTLASLVTAALSRTAARTASSVVAALSRTAARTAGSVLAALQATSQRTAASVTAALSGTFARSAQTVTAALGWIASRAAQGVTAALTLSVRRTAASVTAALSGTLARTAASVTAVLSTLGLTRTAQSAVAVLASRFGRPEADVSAGNWTVAPLWSKVDEE